MKPSPPFRTESPPARPTQPTSDAKLSAGWSPDETRWVARTWPNRIRGGGRAAWTRDIAGWLCLAAAAACGSDFPGRSEIFGLRFLAVQASPPWIEPGEAAVMTPLVVGQAPGRTLRYEWTWCPLRGPNSVEFECLVTAEQVNEAFAGQGVEFDERFFDLGTTETATFAYFFPPEIIEDICLTLRSQGDITNLVTLPECTGSFPISIRVDVTDGESVITAFKDLTLVYDTTSTNEINSNPDISDLGLRVTRGGSVITGPLDHDVTYFVELGLAPGQSALEQLDVLSQVYTATRTEANEDNEEIDVPFRTREQITFSWFAGPGSWDDSRTGFLPDTVQDEDNPDGTPIAEAWARARSNLWEAPSPGDFPGGPTTLFLVVRDERGGTSWTQQSIEIGEAPQ